MQRRSFLKASLMGTSLGSLLPAIGHASPLENNRRLKREFYELRVYTLQNKTQEKLVEGFFEKAAIPALNRLGCKNIGVFKEYKPEAQTKIYVVIPFKSVEDFMKVEDKLAGDEDFIKSGDDYLSAPATAPAYETMERALLYSFAQMPGMLVPENRPRIFELRQYQSASEMAGKKKVAMFNQGELEIFKRVGLNPVFFGEAISGSVCPSLTYMLTYDNMAAHDRGWKWFAKDPDWKKMQAMPEYSDENLISKFTSVILVPFTCSQV